MRAGAYGKAISAVASHADPRDIPRLKWLVEGSRAVEGSLHSAKRMVSKSEAPRACQRGWVERRRGGAYVNVRDATDIPRLKWLVEEIQVAESALHSAKRW